MSAPNLAQNVVFGRPMSEFICVLCDAPGSCFLSLGTSKRDHDKPCLVLAYVMCARCASENWESAGEEAMRCIRSAVNESKIDSP